MKKEEYIKITKEKLSKTSKKIMLEQIERYYKAKEYKLPKHNYKIGDSINLLKGTLLHGTYKNIEGLKEIVKDGLISSWFIDGRISKYPSSVGVWNLKQKYLLKDYINLYSGGTILYGGIFKNGQQTGQNKTALIPYNKMPSINSITSKINCHMWTLEQTKEARFMPSLSQNRVQIGIIFNGNNKYAKSLLKGDILNPKTINDNDVKDFINPNYYDKFIIDRKNKDDFFTDRESAILFGIPSNLIEGILVGKTYEKNKKILKEIKQLLPNAYICNLDGIVIRD
ncbi:MAG: hypothetical protein VZS44_05905 [Bacilli bacterium]|nr:hypothetical protein [Bacilli bacterium]